MSAPFFSVVVCTHDRSAFLARALESLRAQTLDPERFEVVVVDNASTDETAELVRGLQPGWPLARLRLVHEPELGAGRARNRGVRESRGEWLAFLDDDAAASADWLATAWARLHSVRPAPAVLGGVILPLYEAEKPGWFRDDYEIRSWGPEARWLAPGEAFSGSNLFVRRRVFEALAGFDTEVEIRGRELILGEDTALFERLWTRGDPDWSAFYAPELQVLHSVPATKMVLGYRLKRGFAWGQSWSLRHRPASGARRAWVACKALASAARFALRALAHPPRPDGVPNWVEERVTPVASELGRAGGCLGIHVRLRQ